MYCNSSAVTERHIQSRHCFVYLRIITAVISIKHIGEISRISMLSPHFLPNNSFQKSVSDTAYPQSQAVRFWPDFLRLTPFSPFYLYFMAVFVIISIKKYLMRLAKGEGTLWHTKSSQALLNPRTALITVHITSMFRFFL